MFDKLCSALVVVVLITVAVLGPVLILGDTTSRNTPPVSREWEDMGRIPTKESTCHSHLWRTRVDGGWLYVAERHNGVAITFVKD